MIGDKAKRRTRRIAVLWIVLAVSVILSVSGAVLARYFKVFHTDKGVVTSKNMYFTSDYLTESGAEYNISSDSVTIQLMNYPDQLRVSDLEVTYTVTVEGGEYTLSNASGTLTASEKSSTTFTVSNLERGKTYTVTAIGQGGYKTTLKATFTVAAPENHVYMRVTQNDYYVLLTVWTQKATGNATVTFPTTLLPDNTDPILRDVTQSSGSFTDTESFEVEYSSRTYRFFKTDNSMNYTTEHFKAKVGETNAESSTN